MLQDDLQKAIDDVRSTLARAQEASEALNGLVPRLAEFSALFEHLDTLVRSGREKLAASATGSHASGEIARMSIPRGPELEQPRIRVRIQSSAGPLDLGSIERELMQVGAVRDISLVEHDSRTTIADLWIEEGADTDEVAERLRTDVGKRLGADVSILARGLEAA